MATYTPNYNLKKPGTSDNVIIGDLNGNMDLLDSIIHALPQLDDLYYKNGDTYETSESTQFPGMCNNAGTGLVFTVVVPKSLKNISTVTATYVKGIIYGESGRVDSHNSSSYNWLTNYSVTASIISDNAVKVTITTDGGSYEGASSNTQIIASLTLKLSFAT